MSHITTDICIIGAEVVGLTTANQILGGFPDLSISILEKELDRSCTIK